MGQGLQPSSRFQGDRAFVQRAGTQSVTMALCTPGFQQTNVDPDLALFGRTLLWKDGAPLKATHVSGSRQGQQWFSSHAEATQLSPSSHVLGPPELPQLHHR